MTDNKTPFVIPNGAQIQITEAGAELSYDGDIELHGDLGFPIQRLKSVSGNVIVHYNAYVNDIEAPNGQIIAHGHLEANRIEAAGIHIHGDLKANQLRCTAHNIVVEGGLKCDIVEATGECHIQSNAHFKTISVAKALSIMGTASGEILQCHSDVLLGGAADLDSLQSTGPRLQSHGPLSIRELTALNASLHLHESTEIQRIRAGHLRLSSTNHSIKAMQILGTIQIEGGEILSDLILADTIQFAPETQGKVMVVEARNDSGPHLVKGCLQLEDLAQLVPHSDTFLQQYGLSLEDATASIPQADFRPIERSIPHVVTSPPADSSPQESDDNPIQIDAEQPSVDSSQPTEIHSPSFPESGMTPEPVSIDEQPIVSADADISETPLESEEIAEFRTEEPNTAEEANDAEQDESVAAEDDVIESDLAEEPTPLSEEAFTPDVPPESDSHPSMEATPLHIHPSEPPNAPEDIEGIDRESESESEDASESEILKDFFSSSPAAPPAEDQVSAVAADDENEDEEDDLPFLNMSSEASMTQVSPLEAEPLEDSEVAVEPAQTEDEATVPNASTSPLIQNFFDDDSEELEDSEDEVAEDQSSILYASVVLSGVNNIANIQEENLDTAIAISDEVSEEDDEAIMLGDIIEDEEDAAVQPTAEPISADAAPQEASSYPMPVEEPSPTDDLQILIDQLHIIEQFYTESPPEAVQRLHSAIHSGQIFSLGSEITQIFSLLNKHHQRINSRMHPQVVHSFNIIHQHVQNFGD